MKPVPLEVQDFISEVFIDEADLVEKGDLVDEELVLIVEGNSISLTESILDNILLNIPLSVLTEEEAKSDEFPSGKNWSVMTESQFQVLKEAKKQQTNPFAALNGLFDEEWFKWIVKRQGRGVFSVFFTFIMESLSFILF